MKTADVKALVDMLSADFGTISGDLLPAGAVRAGSQESMKSKFKRLTTAYLKHMADKLGFKRGDFAVRFNPGGPAISGEAYLYSMGVFFMLSAASVHGALYRRCARVPATGSRAKPGQVEWSHTRSGNYWMPFSTLTDVDAVVTRLRWVMSSAQTGGAL